MDEKNIIDVNDIANDEDITYVPVIVEWGENGKTEQKKINVEEGMTIKLEQSQKAYTAKAYDKSSESTPVWEMDKEDAYNILGISHAFEDGYIKDGKYTYVLDSEDILLTKKATPKQLNLWIGKDGQFVKAEEIKSDNSSGGLRVLHKGKNKEGKKGTFEILILKP